MITAVLSPFPRPVPFLFLPPLTRRPRLTASLRHPPAASRQKKAEKKFEALERESGPQDNVPEAGIFNVTLAEERAAEEAKAKAAGLSPRVTQGPGYTSGTTANVSLVYKDTIITANAGDCRSVLCRAGTALDLSVDHKPEDEEERK